MQHPEPDLKVLAALALRAQKLAGVSTQSLLPSSPSKRMPGYSDPSST
jgi:hypothetical protein